jgi:hypothetical protein
MGTPGKRRENIGPSHYSAILGYNQFKTLEDIKEEIEIGYKVAPTNVRMELGINKEEEVIKLYETLRVCKIQKAHWVRKGRILGKADGLINKDGGVEIKCHFAKEGKACLPMPEVPIYHLVQVLGYLHLYKREWWDVVSCCFSLEGKLSSYRIHRIYWKDFSESWQTFWFPQILDFIKEVQWPNTSD